MAVGCGAKCAKFMLILFNIIFWLSGCAILGVGIWMRVDRSILSNLEVLAIDENDPLLVYASYVLIGMGAAVFIIGFLGCCGAIKENRCMLGLYIFFLLLIMAGELAAGILALLYRDEILDTATDVLVTKLQNDTIYKTDASSQEVEFTAFGLAMSISQLELKCCGINNITDYAGGAFEEATGEAFPLTCCVMKENTNIVDGMDLVSSVADQQKCKNQDDDFVYKQGCKDGLEKAFTSNAVILIGLGIGVACLELFGFIFAVCLCRNTGDED